MGKAYAITDLHGRLDLWKEAQKIFKEDDKIFFLGDAMDRGPYGYELMLELLQDKRVTYIKGNHEDLMEEGIRAVLGEGLREDFELWYQVNGGYTTWNKIKKCSDKTLLGMADTLHNLPCSVFYVNKKKQVIFMNHAGVPPFFAESATDYDFMWKRTYYLNQYDWTPDWMSPNKWRQEWNNTYLVHGHTPSKTKEIIKYSQGHAFNIDIGAVWFGKAAILDLDTLEPIYIYASEGK